MKSIATIVTTEIISMTYSLGKKETALLRPAGETAVYLVTKLYLNKNSSRKVKKDKRC